MTSMERCPVCRARFKGDPLCRRCRAELGPLLAIENDAEHYARQAVRDLSAGDLAAARRAAEKACALYLTPFNRTLRDYIIFCLGKHT